VLNVSKRRRRLWVNLSSPFRINSFASVSAPSNTLRFTWGAGLNAGNGVPIESMAYEVERSFYTGLSGEPYLFAPTPSGCFVDSSAPRLPRPYPQHSDSFPAPCVLAGWQRGILGVSTQPPGLRPNPTLSVANSPVSPVDRRRLLTAPSNTGWRLQATAPLMAQILHAMITYWRLELFAHLD